MEIIAKNNRNVYKYGIIFHYMEFDDKDKKILVELAEHANLTTSQISRKTRVPITTVHNRIRKMKHGGIIQKYTVVIDFGKIGKPLKAFILITVNQSRLSQSEMGKKIRAIDGVESVDIVTGTTDIMAEVRVSDMHVLNNLITHKIRMIDGIDKTQTLMVLEEIK